MPSKSTNTLLFAIVVMLFALLMQYQFSGLLPMLLGVVGLIIACFGAFPAWLSILEHSIPGPRQSSSQLPPSAQTPQPPFQPYQPSGAPPTYPQPPAPLYQPPAAPYHQPPQPPYQSPQKR